MKIIVWLRVAGTSGDHPVQPPAQAGYSRLPRTVSSQVLNISRARDSTSLGSLVQ